MTKRTTLNPELFDIRASDSFRHSSSVIQIAFTNRSRGPNACEKTNGGSPCTQCSVTRLPPINRSLIVWPVGPHAEGGFLDVTRVAVTKGGVAAAAVALADVAPGRILCVSLVAQVGGAEAGIVPRVRLLDAPDFEDREAGVANCYSPWRVLDLRQPAAGIVPVVDERAVGTYPVFFPGHV